MIYKACIIPDKKGIEKDPTECYQEFKENMYVYILIYTIYKALIKRNKSLL